MIYSGNETKTAQKRSDNLCGEKRNTKLKIINTEFKQETWIIMEHGQKMEASQKRGRQIVSSS